GTHVSSTLSAPRRVMGTEAECCRCARDAHGPGVMAFGSATQRLASYRCRVSSCSRSNIAAEGSRVVPSGPAAGNEQSFAAPEIVRYRLYPFSATTVDALLSDTESRADLDHIQ